MSVMERICKTCKHFRQHYIKRGKKYWEVYDGHCVFPRCKLRKPDTKACLNYNEIEKEN